jgi:hypothetical protein
MLTIRRAAAFALAIVVLGAAASGAARAWAQSNDVVVRVAATNDDAVNEGDVASFDVTVENVENLGAFQFVLQYDPDIFDFAAIERGDFLGSSGREVVCNEPQSDAGTVLYVCNTLRPEPAGPDGGGLVARVQLSAIGSGSTDVSLTRTKVALPDGTELPSTLENTSIAVEGSSSINWLLWGPVIGIGLLAVIGAGAFAMTRMRSGAGNRAAAT